MSSLRKWSLPNTVSHRVCYRWNLTTLLIPEDRVLLAESRKSTKKVPDNRKKYRKCDWKWKMSFWNHGKPEKAYFSCRKPETDPLFLALIPPSAFQVLCNCVLDWVFMILCVLCVGGLGMIKVYPG